MEGIENIYHGLGYLTYAICLSDGAVQDNERNEVKNLVNQKSKEFGLQGAFIDGVFRLTQMEHLPLTTAMHLGIDIFERHHFYLKPELQQQILNFLQAIALANPPITEVEEMVIDKVIACFATLGE